MLWLSAACIGGGLGRVALSLHLGDTVKTVAFLQGLTLGRKTERLYEFDAGTTELAQHVLDVLAREPLRQQERGGSVTQAMEAAVLQAARINGAGRGAGHGRGMKRLGCPRGGDVADSFAREASTFPLAWFTVSGGGLAGDAVRAAIRPADDPLAFVDPVHAYHLVRDAREPEMAVSAPVHSIQDRAERLVLGDDVVGLCRSSDGDIRPVDIWHRSCGYLPVSGCRPHRTRVS